MRLFNRLNMGLRRELTLANFADEVAALNGDSVAITEELPSGDVRALTYLQIRDQVAKWSGVIAARSVRGQPVVIATGNGVDQFLLSLAAARVGRLPAPVNSQMSKREIDHVIKDSGADLVIRSADELSTGKGSKSVVPERATVDSKEVGALFYTSGTTGKPKGAALSHSALVGHFSSSALVPPVLGGTEILASLPIAHIMGFVALLAPMVVGAPVYLICSFSADRVLSVIEERRCAAFIGVPAMYRMMLEAGAESRDLKCVHAWISGADVMPSELAKAFKSMGSVVNLPGIGGVGEATFLEGYGMVELGGGVAAKVSPPYLPVGLGDSLGMPLPGWKMRVVDDNEKRVSRGSVGELQITGPGVINGYWGDSASTEDVITPDGWMRTGDLVRSGPLGSVVFHGRSKNVVLAGGYTIYPLEVEALLAEHPKVAEVAVLGVPHKKLGEMVVAAVRLKPGQTVSEAALLKWARNRMSNYKVPKQVVFVDDLPRTGTNKVQRGELKSLFTAA